jgi:hypothetical protein
MGSLYDDDILEWSEHQADLLRRIASGDPANEKPDWENIIEEVESVGRDLLSSVRSYLMRAMEHDLKAHCWPENPHAAEWQAEARRFRDEAAERYSRSMRQRIDLEKLYRRAVWILPTEIEGLAPRPVPDACPYTLDDLREQ